MKQLFLSYTLRALIVATVFSFFSSCSDDHTTAPDATKTGSIILEFDNVAGDDEFTFNKEYTNAAGEKFTTTILKYYISNISLVTTSGTVYTVPQDISYFLVDESVPTSTKVKLSNIPEGDYKEVRYTVGVDSVRSTMPIEKRQGALDMSGQGKDMYWEWNSGYIFFKMEGSSPAINEVENNFRFHIGGFGGYSAQTINNIKTVTLSMGTTPATVRSDIAPEVHILADILRVFSGNRTIELAKNPSYMFSRSSVDIANNYMNMFSFDHVHNDAAHS
ncbi:MAG TPA: hypothetical protein PLQ21_05095, partial [Candidatus Kapabacteria bacterium]|nr:hypothetical protein [Candidatus Kapabacteria bacterium]